MYSISIHNRDYTSWTCVPNGSFDPSVQKLFDGDSFSIEENTVRVVESPMRQNQNIPGILILENNRSYGRTDNKKRLLYKCKPFHLNYPHFLIPYEIPMGFNKNFRNRFVTFRFDHWNDKHPRAILSQNIGDVDDLPSYYEYQLYCKQLHTPISNALKHCKRTSAGKTHDEWIEFIMTTPSRFGPIIRDDTKHIIAIDPHDCTDRDDAISIQELSENSYKITVYIANVWTWIEAFDMWSHIGNRISTIYLPDKKRSMLPTLIAEEYSSLDAGKYCFVLAMDFIVENGVITDFRPPSQKLICVHKQFHYEDPKLIKNKTYQLLESVSKTIDSSIHDSHDVVAYWMMKMNTSVARFMRQKEVGIYRVVHCNNNQKETTPKIPSKVKQFVRMWEQKIVGKYEIFRKDIDMSHAMIGVNEYVHFTSPIRRMIDLINHLCWLATEFTLPDNAACFVEAFQFNMVNINATMTNIKKIQNDCNILHQVSNEPELLNNVYDAIVITNHNDHMYSVYIEELKWIAKVYSIEPFEIYSMISCKLYVFVKEEQLRKKVRLQVVYTSN